MTRPGDRRYVLIHAHCGHTAISSRSRRSVEAVLSQATSLGLRSWRVRVELPDADRTTCGQCEPDIKRLLPKRRLRKPLRRTKAPASV